MKDKQIVEKFDKRALSISEASKYACVSEATVRNWITSRLIPFEELPGRGNGSNNFRRIRKMDLDKFLDKHYKESRRQLHLNPNRRYSL